MSMSRDVLPLVTGGLIVAFRIALLTMRLWNQPLDHGTGYFLGIAVEPGFYRGCGARWLRAYRGLLLLQHAFLVTAFVWVLASGVWTRMPVLAPVDVLSLFALMGGFALWARRRLGSAVPAFTRVAVPLEPRRLDRYISWPKEAMLLTIIAASWLLLLNSAGMRWATPVLSTYVILGILPVKFILARNSMPLPPERTQEYHRWREASRRHSLLTMELMRWVIAVTFAGYALQHGLLAAQGMPWVRWLVLAVAGGLSISLLVALTAGSRHIARMGRELLPEGSWTGPFQPRPRRFVRGGLAWGVPYCIGLVVLLVWSRG